MHHKWLVPLAGLLFLAGSSGAADRPNILVVLTDDHSVPPKHGGGKVK